MHSYHKAYTSNSFNNTYFIPFNAIGTTKGVLISPNWPPRPLYKSDVLSTIQIPIFLGYLL